MTANPLYPGSCNSLLPYWSGYRSQKINSQESSSKPNQELLEVNTIIGAHIWFYVFFCKYIISPFPLSYFQIWEFSALLAV